MRCHLFDGARSRAAQFLHHLIVLRRYRADVLAEIDDDRVVLGVIAERLCLVGGRIENVDAHSLVDLREEGDEGLALVGLAVAAGHEPKVPPPP